MSHNQEANVSTQQEQQQQPQMAATDALSFAPISNRRGGPMDIGEPMQDIQQLQQPSMVFSSSAGDETLQQQQPQSQQIDNTGGAQCDPRMLMHPLQPQISNQSTQSNQSFQSYESIDSQQQQQQSSGGGSSGGSTPIQQQQQPQQYYHPQQQQQQPFSNPPQATTSSSLTSASGHLAPPQHAHEKSKSRRWSITGRFFEKRKSITEPFNVPGAPPSSAFSSSYKSTNSNIVGSGTGGTDGKGCSWGGPDTSFGGRTNGAGGGSNNTSGQHKRHNGHHNNHHNNNNNTTTPTVNSGSISISSGSTGGTDSKNTSPPGSNGSSRRSSLADLPKAILSSFRRSSIVGPGDAGSVLAAASAASMAASGGTSAGSVGGAIAEDGEELDEDGGSKVKMAVPKAPPQDPHISRPPPKSILKKRPSEINTTAAAAADDANSGATTSGDSSATSASTAAAAAGASATASANANGGVGRRGSDYDQMMSSETVHPMATADMDVKDISLLTPTDHRARLLTHSPTPNHPQQHLVNSSNNSGDNPILMGGAGSPMPSNNSDNTNNGVNKMSPSMSSQGSRGAAIPPDFTPGVQSNSYYKDRGGERGQGTVGDYISQDELLTQQMVGISSRAQDLANQYYGNTQNSQTCRSASVPIASAAAGAGGRRRSINFLETIEIIPAHRKSDYNRQSDKHATFKILTPDMKSEIRDELNTYKMREMAVHVESMANTAFH
ncbi:hypothetical protein BGX24_008687 [Mortierella sp. AD032]|nr:hypothetical protein BGX24_008687 [Mortierella sp. AD032]